MAALGTLARLGLRIASAGSAAALALSIGTTRNAAASIGLYSVTTGGAEKLGVVVGGIDGAGFVANGSDVSLKLQTGTRDGIALAPRGGGSNTYLATVTTAALGAARTYTLPDATGTIALLGLAQTFTATQTFSALIVNSGANPYLSLTDGTGPGYVEVISGDITLTPRATKGVVIGGSYITMNQAVTVNSALTVSGDITASSKMHVGSTADSTSTTTGALINAGGMSWGSTKSAYGGSLNLAGTLNVTGAVTHSGAIALNGVTTITTATALGTPTSTQVLLGNGRVYAGNTGATSIQTAGGITATTAGLSGALTLNSSFLIDGGAAAPTATSSAAAISHTGSTGSAPYNQAGSLVYQTRMSDTAGRSTHYFLTGSAGTTRLKIDETGLVTATGIVSITDATQASSATAASLKTAGGLGVAKKTYLADQLSIIQNATSGLAVLINQGGGTVPSLADSTTMALARSSSASGGCSITLIAGNLGQSVIWLGDTDTEQGAGAIRYSHNGNAMSLQAGGVSGLLTLTSSLVTASVPVTITSASATSIQTAGGITAAGVVTLSSTLTVTGNITQSGASTLTTGTGAIALNGNTTIASAKTLRLGNTAIAGTPTATHTVTIIDAAGTTYRLLCVV